ncbi:PTS glucose transporter subunit IIA [Isoptericola sp. b441]|uniref:PTS glucose transporter subunit IIA n=1 Tax=Actinotalea lenta TaxID=3064654 RepID=A0ABT9D9R7_9CELL|nr:MULTISPECIES: PTS glucose transporter subunit IIA [unclassified Isoptericola]MDO8107241.1 PTS glucose transporter subunit IIA [Isoptericola sp. b441]MDO8121096.1 PTS glucose transporter subunit IIA [Isoptericola sp. b490]
MSTQRRVLELVAPFAGTVVALEDLPDPVYAAGVVGPGLAVRPDPDARRVTVCAPCDGLVHATLPHAVMLIAGHGRQVLVHLGVQVVDHEVSELGRVGERVRAGERLLVWDVRGSGSALASPVVALQAPRAQVLAVVEPGDRVAVGQPLLFWS